MQSFVYFNFIYCLLVWYFSSAKSLQEIEKIQECALRFSYSDHRFLLQQSTCEVGKMYYACFLSESSLLFRSFQDIETSKPVFHE